MKKIKKLVSLFVIISTLLSFASCTSDTNTGSENSNDNKGDFEAVSVDTPSGVSTGDNHISNNSGSGNASNNSQSAEGGHNHSANDMFILDLAVEPSKTEPGIINAIFTVNHLHCGLLSVEFFVTYTSNTVEGVYTNNDEMVATMTKVPMYETTSGAMLPKFEQMCTYKKASSIYECRYVDLLTYPLAVSETKCEGLTSEGQLVITIPFKVNSDAKAGDIVKFDYIEGSVKGTSIDDFKSVTGYGYAVTYTLTENDIVK